ncbi:MFS transporter [Flexivirga caeni]|uniref:MFS transporter n=1 Tax=Flexivirga caeni TaxID=2294115 RepID=A0A3M9MGP5_9MICO|nr:MFS transporter [Flexivirga caeni]RNI24730.1 MFS transporter [Flexivirga caeni]
MTFAPAAVAPPLGSNREFRLLWFGEAVSVLGSMTTTVVLPVLAVTALHASAQWMGLLTAGAWLPWLLLALPAGAYIDRGDNRRIMIAADFVGAAVLVSVPIAAVFGRLTLIHLLLAALGGGVKEVIFRTAYPGLLTQVVHPNDLERANGRVYGTESAMQVAGPGVGGVLIALVPAAQALLMDVTSFAVSIVCLCRIRPAADGPDEDDPRCQEPLRTLIREGLRVTVGDRYLRWFAVQGGVTNFALTGYQALLVLWMVRDLGTTPEHVGLLLATGSVGGLVGAAAAGRISRRLGNARGMLVLQILGGPTALLIGSAGPGAMVWLIPLGAGLVGAGVVGANVIRGAFRQRWTPPHLLGRTTGAASMINFGTMPLAGLAAGWLGSQLGLRPTILLMAGIHAASSLATLNAPWAKRRDLPTGCLGDTWTGDN